MRMSAELNGIFDAVEKETRIIPYTPGQLDVRDGLSSGSLILDLIMGGCLPTGRNITFAGLEHSGKSTLLYSSMGIARGLDVYTTLVDSEGSLDPIWFRRVSGHKVKDLFGEFDSKTSKWSVTPHGRYYKPANGEEALQTMAKVLKVMPDKVKYGDTWMYVYPATADNLSRFKGKFSQSLRVRTGNLYIPVDENYGGPELLFGIDSWVALIPKDLADDDSQALGQQARMFARSLGNIRSLLSKKGATLIGVNQVREKPAVRYGDPTYEPGGNALKFYSDLRIRVRQVSIPGGSGQVETEGPNEYVYVKVKTIKNRCFTPFKEAHLRLWIGNNGGSGYGVDPVYDSYTYWEMTGQLEHTGKDKFKILHPRLKKEEFNWETYRTAVGSGREVNSPWQIAFRQLRSNEGLKKYMEQHSDD